MMTAGRRSYMNRKGGFTGLFGALAFFVCLSFVLAGIGLSEAPAPGTPAAPQGETAPAQITPAGNEAEKAEKKEDEGEEKKEEGEEAGLIAKLIHAYKVGDWPMHFILLMLITIIALSVERFIAVFLIYGKDPAKTFEEIKKAFEEGGLDRALEVAEQNSNLPIGAIMYSALKVIKESDISEMDEKEIKELVTAAVEEEYLRFIPKIQRRIPLIHIFANTAVLLGLLGAVVGLIEAFAGVGALDPAQRQLYLSKAIAVVMHSTAFGLIAAILGVVLFAVISSRANNLIAVIEEYSVRAANWISLMAVTSSSSAGNPKNKKQEK